ncbi:hypothetical protein [Burkholderia phage BCSR5]|nr:hypothetical protein [Burkholderia phage BCSR5]
MARTATQVRAAKAPMLAASEFRFADSNEYAVGRGGELNASSKKDLLQRQAQFLSAASQRHVVSDAVFAATEENKKVHAELLHAAFNDPNTHRVLGQRMAESLFMTANRQGFMRKYLTKITVEQGSIPRFPVRKKDVTAVWSTSPTKVGTTIVRDKWYTPPELSIVARPFVTQNELNQSAGDVLQEKYVEATEAIMVAEDRLWYNQVKQIIGIDNNLTVIGGQLTPYSFTTVMTNVTRWGLKAPHVLLATDLYMDIIGNVDFYSAIDPVARHELLLTGELGVMYGCTITSDAYRHPEHKVLDQGEFFVISDPLNHGAYSDRGGLQSQPIDIAITEIPGRGWVMHEQMAISIANSRSVAAGKRPM